MNKHLRDICQNGYTVVTGSSRLASLLRYNYAQAMLQNGKTAWQTPDILPWQAWLTRSWHEHQYSRQSDRVLLSTAQQYFLWQEIILKSAYARQLLQVKPVIQQVIHAYQLCRSWQIPVFPEGGYLNQDAMAFKSWVHAYEQTLQQNNWIDQASLLSLFANTVSASNIKKIAFYGFDQITPQQQAFIDTLLANANDVIIVETESRNLQASCSGFSDKRDELTSAAFWARQILNRQPDARIGIIVPDLKSQRQTVTAIFDQVFHPELLLECHEQHARHYSISLGRPLTDYPLICIAVQILSLGRGKQKLSRISQILRSSFIKGASTEALQRAYFDASLRNVGECEWRINTLLQYTEQRLKETEKPSLFLDMLIKSEAQFQQISQKLSPREWAIRFDQWLKLWGWPGERELSSVEYQTLDAWKEALASLASLDGVVKKCNYQTALAQLSKIVADTSFQPESTEAPIQISGLPGAAAMQSDFLWVTGLHDQSWPPAVQSNPFIPLSLQREAGLPGSTAGLELNSTRMMTERLIASASQIVFSYPRMDADRECRPSPVIRKLFPVDEKINLECSDDYRLIIYRSASTEFLADAIAPAVIPGKKASGGSSIFKDQAACPFRAFARHRLFATSLAELNIGLNPAARGLLAHNTMQYLWQGLQSSDALSQKSDEEVDKIITDAVAKVIRYQSHQQPESFTRRFSELETQRMVNLAHNALMLERQRPPFRVREIEQWHQVKLGDLEVSMRVDRIDELADGRLIVIDYKTGRVNPADWYGERPGDPQLPLYAITADGSVAAIAYASLKHGDYRFAGLAEDDGLLADVKAAMDKGTGELLWETQLQQWRTVLGGLARDFLEGKAAVDPKDHSSCRYCDLHTLCRIHELRTMSLLDEDNEQ